MRKNRWSRLWHARDGLGAIEFGFIAPLLLTLLLGIIDFGMAYWDQMQVANAADAGAQWGVDNSYDASTSPGNIATVAASATNISGLVTSASNPCGCPTSTGVTVYSCTSTCPDNSTPQHYIVVDTKICYSTLFSWPGLNYCGSSNTSTSCGGCNAHQVALTAQSVVLH